MKKYLLIALMAVSASSFSQTVNYPKSYDWLNVKIEVLSDGSSNTESVDMKNISRDANNMRYFWKKEYVNFVGTDATNTTFFMYTKVDCQKKIWTTLVLQRFKDNILLDSMDTTNHSFPWNFFDFNKESNRRTYSIICNQ